MRRDGSQEGRRAGHLISVGEIEAMLVSRAELLCWDLFPNGRVHGPLFRVGSLAGEAGQSLFVRISGGKAGNWRDMNGSCVAGRDRGDLLLLIACARFGGELGKAVAWAKSWLGVDHLDPDRLERFRLESAQAIDDRRAAARAEEERNRASARRRWLMGIPIPNTIAAIYLRTRGIELRRLGKAPGALRFHPKVHYGFGEGAVILPAMLAAVTSLAGEHVATHRTFLKADGSGKAGPAEGISDKANKKVLGLFAGAHIPLWKGACGSMPLRDVPAGTDVYVSEGIEDGLTAALACPSFRIVAAVSLGNLAELELPRQMGRLVLIKQNDAKPDAIQGFDRAIAAHRAKGRRVLVAAPPAGAKDWNDVLRYGPAGVPT
jgi:hypothetical protein